ncbi:MAG: hypothetical protein WAW92_02475, partial [Minisyncoccia bacterium]
MEHNKKSEAKAFLSGVFVATAIGGYLLFGSKNAKKNRQTVQDTVENAKAEVMAKLKKMKKLSRDQYDKIVDDVSDKYSSMKEFGVEKANELRTEL